MKFTLKILPLLLLLLIWSCNSEDENKLLSIIVSTNELTFDSNEDLQTLTVSSSDEWTVSGQAEWCKVSPDKGSDGQTVSVSVSANTSSEDRTCALVFSCGEATAKVEVFQYAAAETNYLDMGFDKDATITNYDEKSGELKVQYSLSTPPAIEKGKAIVLPQEYGTAIRVVKDVTVSGNSVTLQTEEGNMCNIFRNIDFILTTDPSLSIDDVRTRSGKKRIRVITPFARNASNATRVDYQGSDEIFSDSRNLADDFKDIFKVDDGYLSWGECNYDINLKGIFYFSFGENVMAEGFLGDLNAFIYYLEGNFNARYQLEYGISGELEQEGNETLYSQLFPPITFPIGSVPVSLTAGIDFEKEYQATASGKISISTGFELNASAKLGVSWSKEAGAKAIHNFDKQFTVYPPTFSAEASLHSKVSYYPELSVKIYNVIGPSLAVKPYLEGALDAKTQATASGKDSYTGWKAKINTGVDLDFGLSLDFGIFGDPEDISIPDCPFNLYDKTLVEAPYKIELVSPENNMSLMEGDETEVTFRVTSFCAFTQDKSFNCPLAFVSFSSEAGGKLDKEVVTTDAEGLATVKWFPKGNKDKLTAKIVDQNGETLKDENGEEIGEVVFEPVIQKLKLDLDSHKDNDKMEIGHAEDIHFSVKTIDADNKETPKSGMTVIFTAADISVSAITDESGIVTVSWAPQKEGDKLTAKVVNEITDNEGNKKQVTLIEKSFAPTAIKSGISIVAPADGIEINEGEAVDVTFRVQYSTGGKTFDYALCDVHFSAEGVSEAHKTNEDGTVTLHWIPQNTGDRLTAEIKDKAGNSITKKVFTPTIVTKEIKRISPESNEKVKKGSPVTVTFQVVQGNTGTPCASETVTFSATSGTLSSNSATTDADGKVSVMWTPTQTGDILTAQLASNKKTATYTVVMEGDKANLLYGAWGIMKQPVLVIREGGITFYSYDSEGHVSTITRAYSYNEATKTITTVLDGSTVNIVIKKLTENMLITPFFAPDNIVSPLARLKDDLTGYQMEDNRDNKQMLKGVWRSYDNEKLTLRSNGTFSLSEEGTMSGNYTYDTNTKMITFHIGGETEQMPVICLNKDFLIMQITDDEEDGGEVFDWVWYKE